MRELAPWALLVFLAGFFAGRLYARADIAHSARRMGAFQFGDTVFRVSEVSGERRPTGYPKPPRNPHREVADEGAGDGKTSS